MIVHFVKFCLGIMLLLTSINIQAKEKLIWVTDDQAELTNYLNDSYVSIGTDTTKLVVQSLLKIYDIDIQLAQLPRINSLLTSLPALCTSNRIKTKQRLQENLFSLPINLYLSTRLYFLDETRYRSGIDLFKPLLNDSGELISLELLFDTLPELTIGVSKGRSFGNALDGQLSKVAERNLIFRAGTGRYDALTKMLFKSRLDFILKFPTQFKREIDDYPEKVQVSSLAVAGNDQYIIGHVACNQSDLGKKVITDVNKILQRLYQQPVFYHAHSRYLSSADVINFNRFYQEVYQVKIPLSLSRHE